MNPYKNFVRYCLTISALSVLLGCSSDTEIPNVSISSPHSCKSYNNTFVTGKSRSRSVMIKDMARIFDNEYQGDSTIEDFYRNYLSKKPLYAAIFQENLKSACLNNSDIGILEAGQIAINETWNNISERPRFAMCWSLSNDIFNSDSLISELKHQTMTANADVDMTGTLKVLEDATFGENYIKDAVEGYCDGKSKLRAWEALALSTKDKAEELFQKEAEEGLRLLKEREKLIMEDNLKMYGSSIFSNGKPKNLSLTEQVRFSKEGNKNRERFLAGLKSSLIDISKGLPKYKQSVISNMDEIQTYEIGKKIAYSCRGCTKQYLLENMREISEVQSVKSKLVLDLLALRDKYQVESEKCKDSEECPEKLNSLAASEAASQAFDCDQSLEAGEIPKFTYCFDNVDNYFNYYKLRVKLTNNRDELRELKKEEKIKTIRFKNTEHSIISDCTDDYMACLEEEKRIRKEVYKDLYSRISTLEKENKEIEENMNQISKMRKTSS